MHERLTLKRITHESVTHERDMRVLLNSSRTSEGAKFAPLLGALIGTLAGAVYWLSVQVWPASVAVILGLAVSTFFTGAFRGELPASRGDILIQVFCLLAKYSALMALSAAKLPFLAPANVALGLVMVCGHAASYALMVSTQRTGAYIKTGKVSNTDLCVAQLLGFAPAVLLGTPGLTGLACGIGASIGFKIYSRLPRAAHSRDPLELMQQLTETSFYLGALAAWSYV